MTIKSPKPSIETLPAITDTAAFDARFDNGEDLSAHIDWTSARLPNLVIKRVNVDFPTWVVEALDEQAGRLGGDAPVADQDLDYRPFGHHPVNALKGQEAGQSLP